MTDINFEAVREANIVPITKPMDAAFTQLICEICDEGPAFTILGIADAQDVEDRADHLRYVLHTVGKYVRAVLNDTAENVPGSASDGIRKASTIFIDAAHDLVGEVCFHSEARS